VCETIPFFSLSLSLSLPLPLSRFADTLYEITIATGNCTYPNNNINIAYDCGVFFLSSGSFLFLGREREIITEASHYVSDTVNVKIEGQGEPWENFTTHIG